MRALALIALGCALSACGPGDAYPPSSPEWRCSALMTAGEGIACEAFQLQEQVTRAAFDALTQFGAKVTAKKFPAWSVDLRPDTAWSDEDRRLFFRDPRAPGWRLWGITSHERKLIELADLLYEKAVLAHEDCHALGVLAHSLWPEYGCDRVEEQVREELTPADGVLELVAAPDFGDSATIQTPEGVVIVHGRFVPEEE